MEPCQGLAGGAVAPRQPGIATDGVVAIQVAG